MPTLRLGDAEKGEIVQAFDSVLHRSFNNLPFPIPKEDFPEFGYELLEPKVRDHYVWLRKNAPDLVSSAMWSTELEVTTADCEYSITSTDMELPRRTMEVPATHPQYPLLLEWLEKYSALDTRVDVASAWLHEVVYSCCSTGQIKRVLPDEVLHFLPKHMQRYFADAERKSRWPSALSTEGAKENTNELADVLTLGSLSPGSNGGIGVAVSRTII